MRMTVRLNAEHAQLRRALETLSIVLHGEEDAVAAVQIQDALRRLSGAMRLHIRREERLMALCARLMQRVGPREFDALTLDHQEEWEWLGVLTQCLGSRSFGDLNGLRPQLMSFMDRLEHQLDAQEARLFPFLEGVLVLSEVKRASTRHVMEWLSPADDRSAPVMVPSGQGGTPRLMPTRRATRGWETPR